MEYFVASFYGSSRTSAFEGDLETESWSVQAIIPRFVPSWEEDGKVLFWYATESTGSGWIKRVSPEDTLTGSGANLESPPSDESKAPAVRIDFITNQISFSPGAIEVKARDSDDEIVALIRTHLFFAYNPFTLPEQPEPMSGTYNTEDVLQGLRDYAEPDTFLNFDSLIQKSWTGGWSVTPHSGKRKIEKITVWLNAFIPNNLGGLSVAVPGETNSWMIPALVYQDCFATDNRSFSEDVHASSRMQSKIEITLATADWTQTHKCDQSIEYDCEDGEVEGSEVASTSRMNFTDPVISNDGHTFETTLSGAANNPLVAASAVVGDIDYQMSLSITAAEDFRAAVLGFAGMVDEFPAFEAYAQADDGPIEMIFQRAPDPAAVPQYVLPGPASVPVSGGATLGAY